MPPKKASGGNKPSKKTVEKAKQKIIEDKTFGLKNKNKSKTVQKYMQSVQAQVKGNASKKAIEAEFKKKKDKEAEEKKAALEKELFKPVVSQAKVPVGVDPKSVVCEFFKKGLCTKGNKCKFSHNLDQERKPDKIDIYTDQRDKDESMDTWDQQKLEQVVESKNKSNPQRKTTIVCKYFLEAIEQRKYGWFWECPNGGVNCQYMHSLPRGYVLKSKKKEEPTETISIEEQIEIERTQLTTRTPLTLEVFLKWKEEKKKEMEQKEKADKEKKEADIRSGKAMRSGRHLFTFNPDLFVDDEDVMDTSIYEAEREEDGPVIRLEATGTSITRTEEHKRKENGKEEIEEEEEEDVADTEVQEDLFNEDEIPDIDEDE